MDRSAPKPVSRRPTDSAEDTALSALTPEDRERLAMDAWEPSLLRKLLEAENKLPRKTGSR